uniref:HTH La-type RNA-binding domain-containing protein n=1 Tax=Meloidogyne javanica TaxID=6303 RepID=A0A915LLM0_MELJA
MYLFISVNDLDGAIKEVQQSEENEEKIPETLSAPGQHHYQSNNNCNSSNASPFLPMLPWWFTAECRHQLLSVPGPEQFIRSNTPEQRPPSSICGAIPMNEEQLKARLTKQLEFYFSRENLINDRYLRCQMDADQYVPIKIVANFPKVAQLSTDFDLIVNVLKSSSQVQVDESGTKVRPMSKRCTIILREIPQNADENEVKSMFQSEDGQCPPYLSLAYGLNDSWYVTFQTEEETQQAFFHLQTLGKTFNGKPVFARIKNGGAPIGADHRNSPDVHQQLLRFSENGLHGQLIIHDLDIEPSSTATNNIAVVASSTSPGPFNLGQILAKYGYVPRATFRPNIPPPTSSVLPPLQPTTTGIGTLLNGLPQPTSYFTQPILRNDICYTPEQLDLYLFLQQQQRYPFRRIQQQLYQDNYTLTFEHQNICEDCGNVGRECCDSSGSNEVEDDGNEEKEEGKEEKDEEEEEKENDENEEAAPQLQLKNVGQNENIIRQQAKETGVEVSPVLVPSSIPRITDDPRINGKGASSISNNQVTTAAVINRRISSPPPQTPIGGGGADLRQTIIQQQQQQWTPLHSLSQQQQHSSSSSALITRNVQPLLSLSQVLNSSGQQHPPYSFNQFVQQLQAGNTRKIFDRNKTSYGGRDQAIVPPFRGAQNTNPYKPRTWSTSNSDWLNKQQKLGNNEGGQWQGGIGRNAGIKRQHQQQQRWVENDGIGIKGGSTSSKTIMRRSGSEYNVNNNTPIVMSNNVLLQQQQQQQLFFDEKRGERVEMLEKHQRQQNKFLYSQQQQDGRQQPKKGRPPFASSNRPTRPTSIRFPEGNNMSAEKEYGVVDQHNFSNLKGLNKIDEQKYDEQQQQPSRRATIGTSTATCTTTCGNSRKINNNVENVYLTVGEQATRTPRSDTISCGSGGSGKGQQQEQQLLLGQQQRRSYAQAMLKRNGSGVGGSVVTGGEEESSSALAKDRKNSTCKESIENNNKNDDNNTNFPPISSLGTEV